MIFSRPRRIAVVIFALVLCAAATLLHAQHTGVFRWGGDAEGGAPYVEADPTNPNIVKGFDVEVAGVIAAGLGKTPQFVQVGFTSLDQSAKRGDFEIGLSGIEDTPARRAALASTVPYYEFREVLTVRAADRDRFATLESLKGKRVGTLGGTIAYELLLAAQRDHGVEAASYDDDVHPYEDLANGRLDAVLLDNVIANRSMRKVPGLFTNPDGVAVGHYIGILSPDQAPLRDRVDGILRDAMRDGRLETIFRKWGVWNDDQPKLFARVIAQQTVSGTAIATTAPMPVWQITRQYIPLLLRAAVTTLILSCLSMMLAIVLGAGIAVARVYGNRAVRLAATAYVEVMRGTPILLQLFVIYYGLATIIRLNSFVAALIGLGLNYAAYESEIYRSALEAIPKGQLEAARVLGFSTSQALRLIRGPQAFRLALAPMTNDFVAMLKDSSLVSVLAMTVPELTKQTQIFAVNLGSWVIPGAICATLYLFMALPISHLARRLEAKWKAPNLS